MRDTLHACHCDTLKWVSLLNILRSCPIRKALHVVQCFSLALIHTGGFRRGREPENALGLKGLPGASNNWIVCLYVCSTVPLTYKAQYLKFGWSYSNQTWTVSSSKDCSHFADITCLCGRGQNVGLRDFAMFRCCCLQGHPCFTNTSCHFSVTGTLLLVEWWASAVAAMTASFNSLFQIKMFLIRLLLCSPFHFFHLHSPHSIALSLWSLNSSIVHLHVFSIVIDCQIHMFKNVTFLEKRRVHKCRHCHELWSYHGLSH